MTIDIDMKTAQWTYELGLGGLSEVAIEALTERLGDEPSRWHPLRRAAWRGSWEALWALANAATAHRRQQEEASK